MCRSSTKAGGGCEAILYDTRNMHSSTVQIEAHPHLNEYKQGWTKGESAFVHDCILRRLIT